MSARLSRTLILSAVLAACPVAFAEPSVGSITDAAAGTEIENSKYQFEGEVNGNAVYVRSGPSDNDYATAKLDKGAMVTVVGIKFEWLKIMPPEGSFCYVAKAYVEKRNDGSIGRVTNTLNVRVGSQLLPMKTKVATKLEPGQDVQIIGEQDEYFKIKPPEGVYFYVNKQYVDPVKRVEVPAIVDAGGKKTDGAKSEVADGGKVDGGKQPEVATNDGGKTDGGKTDIVKTETPTDGGKQPEVAAVPPIEQPSNKIEPSATDTKVADATGANTPPLLESTPSPSDAITTSVKPENAIASNDQPTTQPGITVSADVEFDRLEAELREASKLPLTRQPVPTLLAGYTKLIANPELPESMRRIAELRVQTLTVHNDNYTMALAHEQELKDRDAKRRALAAEGDELMERLKKTGIIFYSAIGTVRPSSLQGGDGTLYRLTDPMTGRTVVYIRSTDDSLAKMTGLFVGVQGDIIEDPDLKLKVITPTTIEPVDQRNVNRSVTAKISPPSLLPGGVLAGSSSGAE